MTEPQPITRPVTPHAALTAAALAYHDYWHGHPSTFPTCLEPICMAAAAGLAALEGAEAGSAASERHHRSKPSRHDR